MRKLGKKHVQSRKISIDGIEFKSNLEGTCYRLLKEKDLEPKYEGKSFTVMDGFVAKKDFYAPRNRKKGEDKKTHLALENKKSGVLGISYTPDFIVEYNGITNIIECKGRPNESFPIRRKLFRKLMNDMENVRYFEPHNIENIKETIKIILNEQKEE